jgi:hypothetical protein
MTLASSYSVKEQARLALRASTNELNAAGVERDETRTSPVTDQFYRQCNIAIVIPGAKTKVLTSKLQTVIAYPTVRLQFRPLLKLDVYYNLESRFRGSTYF